MCLFSHSRISPRRALFKERVENWLYSEFPYSHFPGLKCIETYSRFCLVYNNEFIASFPGKSDQSTIWQKLRCLHVSTAAIAVPNQTAVLPWLLNGSCQDCTFDLFNKIYQAFFSAPRTAHVLTQNVYITLWQRPNSRLTMSYSPTRMTCVLYGQKLSLNEPGSVDRSDARPPGMRTVAVRQHSFWRVMKSFLRPFSPYRWFK